MCSDHPRIRGEHFRQVCERRGVPGSSPHTRGARFEPDNSGGITGIIPAYAGSTPVWVNGLGVTQDHPRIRGEHNQNQCDSRHETVDHPRIRGEHAEADGAKLEAEGSSPHTRGALLLPFGVDVDPGIIPAYAGSTRATLYEVSVVPGSSPHTRGAPGWPAWSAAR